MSDEQPVSAIARRVRALAELFAQTDLLRLRIEREGEEIELGRRALHPDLVPEMPHDLGTLEAAPVRAEQIRADLVGIFHLSRPLPSEGDLLESDRELAFIEALGIRNPVRSHGPGRILAIKRGDGDPVEYGAVLFEIDRG
ncbi:MAG TPA: biotin/lipoyl-containing protein [Candidatus Acidoferrales bacterium]|nr:biotin/lipoyl-containing protein [Candidatus Acidoferrales bacterium]